MVSILVRPAADALTHSGHVRVQVFAGPDTDHRALCGVLTMRPDEAAALEATARVFPAYDDLVGSLIALVQADDPIDTATLRSMIAERWPGIAYRLGPPV